MIIPIRCFSCNKPVAQLWEEYLELIKTMSPKDALDKLGLERYCCRAVFLGQIDLIKKISQFKV